MIAHADNAAELMRVSAEWKSELGGYTPVPRGFNAISVGLDVSLQEVENFHPSTEQLVKNTNGRVFRFYSNKEDHKGIQLLNKSLLEWAKGRSESKILSLEMLRRSIKNLSSESQVSLETNSLKMWMLFSIGEEDQVRRVYKEISDTRASLAEWQKFDPNITHAEWVMGLLAYQVGRFEIASVHFRKALSLLGPSDKLTLSWRLNRAEIRGVLGHMYLLIGKDKKDKFYLAAGKSLLQTAIADVNRYDKHDLNLLARFHNYVSTYYLLSNQPSLAKSTLELSIENFRLSGDRQAMLDPLGNLYLLNFWYGRADEALKTITTAMKVSEEFPDSRATAFLTANLAAIYQDLGKYEAAKTNSRIAEAMFEQSENLFMVAKSQETIGRALRESGDARAAIPLHKASLKYYHKGDGKRQQSEDSIAYPIQYEQVLGQLILDHIQEDKLDKAKEYFNKLDRHLDSRRRENTGDAQEFVPFVLDRNLILARYFLESSKWQSFDRYTQKCEEIFQGLDADTFILKRMEYLSLLMEKQLKTGGTTSANAIAKRITGYVHDIRGSLDPKILGPAWDHKMARVLDKYISYIAREGLDRGDRKTLARLFDFIEARQANNLQASRNTVMSDQETLSISDDVLLDTIVDQETKAVDAESSLDRDKALEKSQRAKISLYTKEGVASQFSKSFVSRGVLSINKIQARLSDNEIVARFFIRDGASLLYLIDSSDWNVFEVADLDEVQGLVKRLVAAIRSQADASAVSQELLTSIGLNHRNLSNASRLIVVPDGPLYKVPFSSLYVERPIFQSYLLGEKLEIVYTLTLGEYLKEPQLLAETKYQNDLAVFADPEFNRTTLTELAQSTESWTQYREWSKNLKRLFWTGKEADSIQEVFPNKKIELALRADATTSRLMSDNFRSSKVMHIASHGYFDEDTPNIVGIATSPGERARDNGFLPLSLLVSKRFPSRLIVISGCETMLGEEYSGEGLNGLGRAMLGQGAGAVVGTLWPIPDRPTAEFMRRFYLELRQSDGNARRALANVKRSFIDSTEFSKPYFWAGFVLISANREMEQSVFK